MQAWGVGCSLVRPTQLWAGTPSPPTPVLLPLLISGKLRLLSESIRLAGEGRGRGVGVDLSPKATWALSDIPLDPSTGSWAGFMWSWGLHATPSLPVASCQLWHPARPSTVTDKKQQAGCLGVES